MEKMVKILLVEDLPTDADLAIFEAGKVFKSLETKVVETEEDFLSLLDSWQPDIVLSDFKLPTYDGLSVVNAVLRKTPITPVIILTGSMNEDTAVDCMKAGATDYVIKEHIKRLGPALYHALAQKKSNIEKFRMEEELKLLSRSIEQSSAAVMITGSKGNIEYLNRFGAILSGYSLEEIIGQNPGILKSGLHSKEFYQEFWNTITSGRNWEGEFINRKKNGEIYWVNSVVSPILNSQGVITHFVSVMEDITEKKKIQQELLAAKLKAEESDSLKSAFLNNISHEIRTPLNGILGFGHMLSEANIREEDRKQFFQSMQKCSDRLLQTVSDYMNIAMIVSNQVKCREEEFFLRLLVYDTQNLMVGLCQEKHLGYEISLPDELKETMVFSDRGLIFNTIKILLSNAVKFTGKGKISFGVLPGEGKLEFFVRDTGKGIAKDKLQAIFEIFTQDDTSITRGYEGSGLGLAIAMGYVKLLGGNLSVDSEIGKGSTFTFTIPTV